MIQRNLPILTAPYFAAWCGIAILLLMPALARAQSYTYKIVANGTSFAGGQRLTLKAIDAQDNLYGTFGNNVFEIPAGTGTLRVVAGNIASMDNISALSVDGRGNIYGTGNVNPGNGPILWFAGSTSKDGTLFEISAGSSTATTLNSFNLSVLDGYLPATAVTLDAAGNLFGTTDLGGAFTPPNGQGDGTIFEIAAGTKTLVNRFSFDFTNGSVPGPLLRDAAGNLHGYTAYGGQSVFSLDAGGTVFIYSPSTNGLINQARFTGTNGGFPSGAIALDQQGDMFGATYYGGDLTLMGGAGGGVVYEVPAGTNAIVDLALFHGWNGQNPVRGVVLDAAGNVWGAAGGGPGDYGVVYRVNPATAVMTIVFAFDVSIGATPYSGLFIDSHGDVFGSLNNDVIYELSPQVGAPVITSFSPTSGLPGTSVLLTGTNFSGATGVTFADATASFHVASSTSITATVPAYARSGAITVTTPSGVATSSTPFTVVVAGPAINGFSPAQGDAGTAVTLFGAHFTGATAVTFNGTPAPFAVTSDSGIGTSVPPGATTGKIIVTTLHGTAASSASFIVQTSRPTVTSFSPASGPIGTRVTIVGGNFREVSAVHFNGVAATFTASSTTAIVATVPQSATTGPISVTTAGGTATSGSSFTVLQAPTIASFSPLSGEVGVKVTIKGAHFAGVTAVKFDGVSAKTFSAASATLLTATVPTNATTGKITVTTSGGTATSKTSFTVVVPAPTIIRFSPTTGRVGQKVDITGTNLSGASRVTFDGIAAAFKVASATAITATVPKGAKTGKIGVTTRGGAATSKTNFTVTK